VPTNENPNYPASNVLNDSPKKSWKAANITPQNASLNVGPKSSALAIFSVNNIDSIIGSVVPYAEYSFYDGVTGYDGVELYQSPDVTVDIDWDFTTGDTAKWEEFISVDGFEIELSITPFSGSYAEIGIITSGESLSYSSSNPSPGFSHGLESYSIEKQTSNGGFFIKNRDVVNKYSGTVVLSKNNFVEFKTTIRTEVKSSPTAWLLLSVEDDYEFLTYSKLVTMITGSRIAPDIVSVQLSLIEMV
jgi:hypothetical protein